MKIDQVQNRGLSHPGRSAVRPIFLRSLARNFYRIRERILFQPGSLRELWPDAEDFHSGIPPERHDLPEMASFPVMKTHREFKKEQLIFNSPNVGLVNNAIYLPHRNVLLKSSPRRMLLDNLTSPNNFRGTLSELQASPDCRIAEPCAIFRGNSKGYAHTVIDDLARLALLIKCKDILPVRELKLIFGEPLTQPEADIAAAMLPDRWSLAALDCGKSYHLDHVFIPENVTPQLSLPLWFHEMLAECFFEKRPRASNRRMLVSRSDANRRRIINEQELFDAIEKYGFEMIVPGKMSFSEQAAIFHDAEIVIGAHGAGLANTMFSRNLTLIEVFPEKVMQPAFYLLGANLGVNYHYVLGTEKGRHADFKVNVDAVVTRLEQQLAKRH